MNSRAICRDHGDDADVPLYVDAWATDSPCIARFLTISGDGGRVSTPAAGLGDAHACQFGAVVGARLGDALEFKGFRDDRLMAGLPVPPINTASAWETLVACRL